MKHLLKVFFFLVLFAGLSGTVQSQLMVKSAIPDTAGVISGSAQVCAGASGIEYMVSPVDNATGYVWVLPEGIVIISGIIITRQH